eukprot:TRINITY_DN33152_c0_g1_i1.p1 TRINITY_DN33152_c0_g1~~TRINITY_DN33152_c0_g1_i1.p1  ORF type:complete len:253 (-),score=58.56 TRINITY_DN33152_c0_g1_i1:117-875(-)
MREFSPCLQTVDWSVCSQESPADVASKAEVDDRSPDYFLEHDADPHDMYAQQLEDQLEEEIAKDTNFPPEAGMPFSPDCQQLVELQQRDLGTWRQRAPAAVELQLPVTVLKINGEKAAVLPMAGRERVHSLKAAIASITNIPPHQLDLLAEWGELGNGERLDRIACTASPGGPLELAVTLVISDREVDCYPVDIFYENDVNIGITDAYDMYVHQLEDELEEEELANATDSNFQVVPEIGMSIHLHETDLKRL